MDFALTDNLVKSLTTKNEWESTWKEVYKSMGQDYQFPNPDNLLIFPDNHDMDRIYSRLNKNLDHWKLAMTLYATMRGIPQVYYGTELLFTQEKMGNDGQRRADFYGGWEGDAKNAVSGKGMTPEELEAQKFFKHLFNWRKTATTIHNGKFKHYAPEKNDVYVYFRYTDSQKIMVILNKNDKKITLDMKTYQDMIPDSFTAKEVNTGTEITVNGSLEIAPKTAMILEMK